VAAAAAAAGFFFFGFLFFFFFVAIADCQVSIIGEIRTAHLLWYQ
jgi:hypothetical protein